MTDSKDPSAQNTAHILVDRGRDALRANQRRQARRYFTTAIASDPTCVAAWRGLAEMTAEPHTALEYLQQAQELAPDDPGLRRAIKQLQEQMQQPESVPPPPPATARPDFFPIRLEPYPASRWRWIVVLLILIVILAMILLVGLNLAPVISAQDISARWSPASPAQRSASIENPTTPHGSTAEPIAAPDVAGLLKAGQTALAAEAWPRALALLAAAQRAAPGDQTVVSARYQAALDWGQWHAAHGHYTSAIHCFDRAQALAPDNLNPARALASATALRAERNAILREKQRGPARANKPAPQPAGVPSTTLTGKWIDIDLSDQTLTAYQDNTSVLQAVVSTGTRYYPTPTGRFAIQRKYQATHMSGPGYSLPNVPYTMFFVGGYAIHGTYWHNNFGTPMSHGCINMRTEEAKWLYDWAPKGTPVVIHH